MNYAIIENGVVTNVAAASAPLADNWIASETARIGDTYADGVFTPPAPDYEAEWAEIRAERNAKLSACDWTQLPDAPVDAVAWATYRQELRDITSQPDPFDIVWPQEPSA